MHATVNIHSATYAHTRVYLLDNRKSTSESTINEYKDTVLKALAKKGLDLLKSDLSFRRTLGCSCGCSSGFVIKAACDKKWQGNDVYVTIR